MPIYEIKSRDNDYPNSFSIPIPAENRQEAEKMFYSMFSNRKITQITEIGLNDLPKKYEKIFVPPSE